MGWVLLLGRRLLDKSYPHGKSIIHINSLYHFERPIAARFRAAERNPGPPDGYIGELYEAIRKATEARYTMRHMDRASRPELAGELEHSPANLSYGQTTFANKRMRSFRAEVAKIRDARSLPEIRKIARAYGREPNRRARMERLSQSSHCQSIGALKRELIEMWIAERNRFAERVVRDMKRVRE